MGDGSGVKFLVFYAHWIMSTLFNKHEVSPSNTV